MTRLADLQAAFQGGVTADADAAVLPLINGSARESAQNLFRVYRYAYAARLVEVLQANFEQTWALLGDEGFDRVLVWRDGTTVRYRPLPSEEAAGLAGVCAGEPFASVCEAVAEIVGQEAGGLRAAEMLRFWLESDMITTLDVEKFTRTCVRSGIQPNIFPPSAG